MFMFVQMTVGAFVTARESLIVVAMPSTKMHRHGTTDILAFNQTITK